MKPSSYSLPALLLLSVATSAFAADPAPAKPSSMAATVTSMAQLLKSTGLTEPQVLNGVKSGLGTAVDYATTALAKPDAFQLSGPSSMAKLQAALVKANQTGALDSFKASLNAAASSVAPQATAALKDSLKTLSIDDAAGLASGAPDSATKILRKTSEAAVRTKLVPLVSQAIAANGSAAKVKDMASKAGPFAAMLGVPGTADLENYVITQVMDTTFGYVAKGEAAIRANPSAIKDTAAAKVFSVGKK